MRSRTLTALVVVLLGGFLAANGLARQQSSVPGRSGEPSGLESVPVRPIRGPAIPLPSEAASAGVTRFSFIAYGDTRSQVDGQALQPDHGALVTRMVDYVRSYAATRFPIRFVVQSGDAVVRGHEGDMWNTSFSPLVEILTRRAGLPYFFAIGNHDAPPTPLGARAIGVQNTLTAVSQLIPPEGSPRRLTGYPTYAFGYGSLFAIAIDSNIADDPTQLGWVADQLEHLDRRRFPHVMLFFHHPIFSSGPHGGSSPGPSATMAEDSVEPQTAALRRLYAPLLRRHHVRMTLSGHDHFLDRFVERYTDDGVAYRRDDVVSGGGGAPTYTYRGEPELKAYLAAGADQHVRVAHPMRPGATAAENQHHFLIVRVDGDRLSMEAVGIGPGKYRPFNGYSRVDLSGP